jgi:hypothetical protein
VPRSSNQESLARFVETNARTLFDQHADLAQLMFTKFELCYLALVRGSHAWDSVRLRPLPKLKIVQQLMHYVLQEISTATLPLERARILPDECRHPV